MIIWKGITNSVWEFVSRLYVLPGDEVVHVLCYCASAVSPCKNPLLFTRLSYKDKILQLYTVFDFVQAWVGPARGTSTPKSQGPGTK